MTDTHDVLELIPGLGGQDASTDLTNLGTLHIGTPTSDINGDGVLDTVTERHASSQWVLTDSNRDGVADHLTIVDDDGDFAAWVFHPGGGAHWTRIDHGRVGK